MNMTRFLLDCFDYAIFLPAAVLCILPVLRHSRIRLNILLPVTFSGLILLTLLMAFTRSALNIDPNIPLLIALLPSFLCYLAAFDVSRLKLWYIFISSVAVFSFGGLSTHYVEAMLDSESEELISCSIKWGVSLLFLAAEALFLKKLRWLLDNDYVNVIWKFVWLVPAMITVFNFIMIPVDYENVRVGRIFQMYLMYQFTLVTFFIFFLIMQYGIARAITVKTEAERNSQILGTQAAQYEKLKKYMDSTARLRHDFFFLAKTAQSLAAEGENEQLRQLLNDYCAELDANAAPVNYCENTALNALTSYYAEEARRLYTAHQLTLYARSAPPEDAPPTRAVLASAGQAPQRITGKKIGEVSVTYATAASPASGSGSAEPADLRETAFGLQLLAILRRYRRSLYVP